MAEKYNQQSPEFRKWYNRVIVGDTEDTADDVPGWGSLSKKSCHQCGRWNPKDSIPCGIASAHCVNSLNKPYFLSIKEAELREATPASTNLSI